MPAPGDQYGNVKNPFEEPRVDQFSAQEIATLQSRLNKQLGPEYISQRPGNGGGRVAYLEGNKAIALANEVFGFNGWSSSLGQVQIDYVDENSSGKVSLGLSIVVRITLKCGTYHEDIGYGSVENGKGKAASFEKAKKEAATDGLKRALRTFGNVLGNCLYDKEYLKKVQNMKVKPIRFNEENLHRHADFMPPPKKEEPVIATSESHQTPAKPNGILRTRTEHLDGSVVGEFDDEDDGALFDGVELTEHSEDLTNDQTTLCAIEANKPTLAPNDVTSNRTSPATNTGPPRRSPNQVMQSAPALRGTNVVQQTHTPQNVQNNAPGRPPTQMHNGRGPQTPIQQQAPRSDMNRQKPGATTITDIHALPVQQNGHPPPPPNQPFWPTPPQAQQPSGLNTNTTPGPNSRPVGFVTSRVAEQMQKSDTASLTNLAAFNPHAESPVPKAKRTPGVDYTRSVPIKRGELGAPPAPPSLAPHANNGNAGGFNKPGTAAGGPVPRGNTNFVNPHQDVHRRIGAPGGMGGMARTSAYKVPSKRPPLGDVSNQNQSSNGSEPETKRQRVEGVAPGVGTENGGTGNVEA